MLRIFYDGESQLLSGICSCRVKKSKKNPIGFARGGIRLPGYVESLNCFQEFVLPVRKRIQKMIIGSLGDGFDYQ